MIRRLFLFSVAAAVATLLQVKGIYTMGDDDLIATSFGFPVENPTKIIDYGVHPSRSGDSCFTDDNGQRVDWSELFHAGEDWFVPVNTPVKAIADGIIAKAHNTGSYPGDALLIEHALPDNRKIYSMYGHIDSSYDSSSVGTTVRKGDVVGKVTYQEYNGLPNVHLHWEIRNFFDASFVCENAPVTVGVGYTYPNYPNYFPGHPGKEYFAPSLFIQDTMKPKISVALVIDATGSMQQNDPQGARRAAARAFIDATQPGDKIAVVSFNTTANTLAPLTTITSKTSEVETLKLAVDQVGNSGSTDINAGLDAGYSELFSDDSENRKVAILLTDGHHNDGLYDSESHLQYANQGWQVYTVGLGDADLALLNQIASETGGKCFNECNVLNDPNDLKTLYQDISTEIASGNSLLSKSILMTQGASHQLVANLPSSQSSATFFSSWSGSEASLSLVSPSCRYINSATVAPNVYHAKESTYEIFTIQYPEPGQWALKLYGTDVPVEGEEVDIRVSSRGHKFVYLPVICKDCNSTSVFNTVVTSSLVTGSESVASSICPPPLQAPSALQATPLDTSRIRLNWDDNSDSETNFIIYEGDTWVATLGSNTTSHIVEDLGINSYHCYRIQALNEYGNSLWSNSACSVTDSLPLTGTVTDNNAPASGTEVLLRFYDGSIWSTFASTLTDSNGNYEFTDLPPLSENQSFHVRWNNNSSNSNQLWAWICWGITSSTTNPDAYKCNFDLDNMDMLSPSPGETISLPYTFTWDKRTITTDDYELVLADASDLDPWWWTYPSLGFVDSYTLNSLPDGFVPGEEYGWWLWVNGPDGYGVSYYYYNVTFANAGFAEVESVFTPMPKENLEMIIPPQSP